MTTPSPPRLLAATAARLLPDLPAYMAARRPGWGETPVVHLGRPAGQAGLILCNRPGSCGVVPADHLTARALPLCRSCARRLSGRVVSLSPSREDRAAWYAANVLRADSAGDEDAVQVLCSGAILAGLAGIVGRWTEHDYERPLHDLMAPYRTVPGGLAERDAAARRNALSTPYTGPGWAAGW